MGFRELYVKFLDALVMLDTYGKTPQFLLLFYFFYFR